MVSLSPLSLIGLTLGFFIHNLRGLVRRLWLPSLLSGVALYLTLLIYLDNLQQMIREPTEERASIVLGFFSAATLLLLLLYSIISATVCDAVLKPKASPAPVFRLGYFEWRLYAAVLRLTLLTVSISLVIGAIIAILRMVITESGYSSVIELVWAVILITLIVRLAFLLPAITIAEERGLVIRRAWLLSYGWSSNIFVIAVALVLPGLAVELAGEYIAKSLDLAVMPTGANLIERQTQLLLNVLPYFVLLFSLTAVLTIALQSIASALVYRALQGELPLSARIANKSRPIEY